MFLEIIIKKNFSQQAKYIYFSSCDDRCLRTSLSMLHKKFWQDNLIINAFIWILSSYIILSKLYLLNSPTIIDHLFIVVSRIRMKTRKLVIINYWFKFCHFEWEENYCNNQIKCGDYWHDCLMIGNTKWITSSFDVKGGTLEHKAEKLSRHQ